MLSVQGAYTPWIHLAENRYRGPWTVHNRVLAHYLLAASYEDSEDIVVAGKPYSIPRNGVYLVQPGVLSQRVGPRATGRPAWLHFDVMFNPRRGEHGNTPSFVTDHASRAGLWQPNALEVWGVDLPVEVPDALRALFARNLDAIVDLWRSGDPHDHLQANLELQSLLLTWIRHEAPRAGVEAPPVDLEARLRRAEAIARVGLAHNFGVDEFAEAARLRRAHFSRVYEDLRGKSPGQALRDMRIDEAERLLRQTTLSVHEIGELVGYPNPTVFGRCFRRRHGMTPSAWRGKS